MLPKLIVASLAAMILLSACKTGEPSDPDAFRNEMEIRKNERERDRMLYQR